MLRTIPAEHKVEMQHDVIYSTMLTIVSPHALYVLNVSVSQDIASSYKVMHRPYA